MDSAKGPDLDSPSVGDSDDGKGGGGVTAVKVGVLASRSDW